jgi:hypothetical protein
MATNDPVRGRFAADRRASDYLNTTIPVQQPAVPAKPLGGRDPDNNMIHLDGNYAIPDYMAPMKKFWDEQKLAVLHGVGFKDSPRSHFRAMDIWHHLRAREGRHRGLARQGCPRIRPEQGKRRPDRQHGPEPAALAGRPRRAGRLCRRPLERYGFLPQVQGNERAHVLDRFAKMYSGAIGSGPVMDYLSETATDSLKGEDIIKVRAAEIILDHGSSIRIRRSPASSRGIAQTTSPKSGSRSSIATTAPFDTHAGQNPGHGNLWRGRVSRVSKRSWPICASTRSDNVFMQLFSSSAVASTTTAPGTDHGAGGVAFVLGEKVKGGAFRRDAVAEGGTSWSRATQPEHGLPQCLLDDPRKAPGDSTRRRSSTARSKSRLPEHWKGQRSRSPFRGLRAGWAGRQDRRSR